MTSKKTTSVKNTNNVENSTVHGNIKQENVTNVYNNDNVLEYETPRIDVTIIEFLSKLIIGHIGESKTSMCGIILLLFGFGGILIQMNFIEFTLISSKTILYGTGLSLFSGALLISTVQYKKDSRCAKCGSFYSMKEEGTAKRKDVKDEDVIHRTEIRKFRCNQCGQEEERKSIYDVEKGENS